LTAITDCPAISALVVAVDLLMKYCKKLKYIKNIILITDAQGDVNWDGSEDIAQQINELSINLSILYVLLRMLISQRCGL
jgi:ATP-dependent DNA helicase 2 subunit 2